jgi:DNA-binding response OmpR family regulator
MYKLLMVDDDKDLLKMLENYFRLRGYAVLLAGDGLEALKRLEEAPDLILLDINMPRMDGLELCVKIREFVSCPILFLTAKVEEQDRINGLLSGGDDYIIKPFSLKELEARVIAHIKREERKSRRPRLRFQDGLMLDYSGRKLFYEEIELELTKLEYDIVEFLSRNPGQVFDKERIYEKVCGYDGEGDSRVITELIRRIRKKIGEYSQVEYIETVWGSGYRWKK